MTNPRSTTPALNRKEAAVLALGAVVAFQLAYTFSACSFLIVIYLYCLFQLARLATTRLAFYLGLAIGVLSYAPQSLFLWNIFGAAAIPLWLILAFWVALFLALARLCMARVVDAWSPLGRDGALRRPRPRSAGGPDGTSRAILGHWFRRLTLRSATGTAQRAVPTLLTDPNLPALLLIPFLWTGLDDFRSELYYLRFSWLNAGYAFAENLQWLPIKQLGVYGMGFLFMAVISLSTLLQKKQRIISRATLLAVLGILSNLPGRNNPSRTNTSSGVQVAGVQMEFPSARQIVANLNHLIQTHPQAQLLVLSEYSVDGSVPEQITAWCRNHQRYLVIGGKDPVSGSQFYDTAFVIGPSGDVVFQQAKSVPIQFFKDGLPASEQKLWQSPWGRIGICICYDMSYTRVTDELIRLGAQAIIVPSMDAMDWGRQQHELHARVAPIRAAEYGVPIFRLASSGISQAVSPSGCVLATAPMPGEEAMISEVLDLKDPGTLPLDRMIAPSSVWITGLTFGWLSIISLRQKSIPRLQPNLT